MILHQIATEFLLAGYELIPLHGKFPLKNWRFDSYADFDWNTHFQHGGNLGVRLRKTDLIIDLDPRHFAPADNPLKRLCATTGLDQGEYYRVLTGGGGLHIYVRKPADVLCRWGLPEYPGIDFKQFGGFVVAPGSVRPDTCRLYRPLKDCVPLSATPNAPAALIDLLKRPERKQRTGDGGEITPEQLAKLLTALDPSNFREYSAWIALAAACHDATGGYGHCEFIAWCTSDPAYSTLEDAENIERHWESFTSGREGGATYRTLFNAVQEAGRGDLILAVTFDDEEFDLDNE